MKQKQKKKVINVNILVGEQNHQILRSASTWSLGLEAGFYEKSIYEAYQDLIINAK